jgi:hypothetical protein
VRADCGASEAARSVLAYAWNARWPIRNLWKLDPMNRKAAMTVIDRASSIDDHLIRSLVPEIHDWVDLERKLTK